MRPYLTLGDRFRPSTWGRCRARLPRPGAWAAIAAASLLLLAGPAKAAALRPPTAAARVGAAAGAPLSSEELSSEEEDAARELEVPASMLETSLRFSVDVGKADDVLAELSRQADALQSQGGQASEAARASWRAAQRAMLDLTAPIRGWMGPPGTGRFRNVARSPLEWSTHEGKPIGDEDFFEDFMLRFEREPRFFLGLIYIPLPWKFIVERAPRQLHTREPLEMATKLLRSLDASWQYFTLMEQSHVGQFILKSNASDIRWDRVLVFDSRGTDGAGAPYPRVPIPLLYRREFLRGGPRKKAMAVFFAGSCHGEAARRRIGQVVPSGKLAGGRYDWDVRPCDQKIPHEAYQAKLRNATWVITPPGSMPTSFQMYEALQVGAIPIIPYSGFEDAGHLKTSMFWPKTNEPFLWLPYRDIGVRWESELAELVPMKELDGLRTRIEGIPDETVARRQALLEKLRPLFTTQGLIAYIYYVVPLAYQIQNLTTAIAGEYGLGRALAAMGQRRRWAGPPEGGAAQ